MYTSLDPKWLRMHTYIQHSFSTFILFNEHKHAHQPHTHTPPNTLDRNRDDAYNAICIVPRNSHKHTLRLLMIALNAAQPPFIIIIIISNVRKHSSTLWSGLVYIEKYIIEIVFYAFRLWPTAATTAATAAVSE